MNRFKSKVSGASPLEFTDWKTSHYRLYRASELATPAPPGHFLRTFGQSDRLGIENGHRDASVPQALALMNGELVGLALNPYSVLSRSIAEASDPAEILDSIGTVHDTVRAPCFPA